MSEHYPKIRIRSRSGNLLLREGLSITFYIRRSHRDLAQSASHCLDIYLRAVGANALGWYNDGQGEWQELNEAGWMRNRRELVEGSWCRVTLRDVREEENSYWFEYIGKDLDAETLAADPGAMSVLSVWLPTEYLEEHGPARVQQLALELAAQLPFCFGHAGLSFNGELDLVGILNQVEARCFRYPGLDIPNLEWLSWKMGTRVSGAYWMTFLGQPVLEAIGGVSGLRSRLSSPEITVEAMSDERAVVTLGEWPEAGDTEQGQVLPAYRELARVLEPWTYREEHIRQPESFAELHRRWERRFLD